MKKQTAVEWLFLMLNNPNRDQDFANKLFEQAKEMEKEQIIEAYKEARNLGCKCYDDLDDTNAEPFYNQTYKDINL